MDINSCYCYRMEWLNCWTHVATAIWTLWSCYLIMGQTLIINI
jgi:hypothetical protein